jgi:leucyl aminopeptidase
MIKINFDNDQLENKTVVVGIYSNMSFTNEVIELDVKTDMSISRTIKNSYFKGEIGEYEIINSPAHTNFIRIVIIGLGQQEDISELQFQKAGSSIISAIGKYCDLELSLYFPDILGKYVANILYGMLLKQWKFEKYKTGEIKQLLNSINLISKDNIEAKSYYQRYSSILDGVLYARYITAEPSNIMFPKSLADKCMELEKLGIKIEVFDQQQIEKLGMNALLAVAKGSCNKPYVVVMKWEGKTSEKPIAFVGKGVCFDSGGISIKQPLNMHEMTHDMAGAAAVIGAMIAIAKQNLNISAVGILGLVENMPDANAQKPGDVVISMSGKTIEVVDTDANLSQKLLLILERLLSRLLHVYLINMRDCLLMIMI